MEQVDARWRTAGLLLGLLIAGTVLACLFSFLLPPSASLLAPTRTLTPTLTSTPTLTATPTITQTPLPTSTLDPDWFATPNMTLFPGFNVFESRELWEEAVGENILTEDFERDSPSYDELRFPYFTCRGLVLTGASSAQILRAPELLPTENLLHFRDWETGLAVTLPNDAATNALGFEYSSQEDWQLSLLNIGVVLPRGSNQFVGIILYVDSVKFFKLMGPSTAQGGLSIDNISYVP